MCGGTYKPNYLGGWGELIGAHAGLKLKPLESVWMLFNRHLWVDVGVLFSGSSIVISPCFYFSYYNISKI